tara:strand:+ start:1085 stop:2737 length:1653 start_codon:yes stop_codon:yes gene_type:complete
MQSFNKYGLNQNLLNSIKDLEFNIPTSIQDKVIPQILSSEYDIIATAQTGTGKTAAFGLPIINLTINHSKNIESVILCPTRELCIQISKDLNIFSKYMDHYKIIPIYGGTKIESQIRGLRNNPKIIVCTPGRLNDLILRKKVNLSQVKYFVLDEADEMLSMGFKTEIDKVLNQIPLDRKIYLFSATLSKKVKNITDSYMKKPLMISASNPNKGADTVKHIYYISNKNKRYDIIRNIIDINKDIYTIIFCRTRRETKDISKKLIQDNYNAKVLNGDLSQNERDNVMNQFRSKEINILVATDVASRGIDVNNLSHIINYNLPDDAEVYVHRSGRTGRAGKHGLSIVFISTQEYKRLDEIKRLSKISFEKKDIPNEREVFKSRMSLLIDKVTSSPLPSEKDREIFKNFYSELDNFSKEELIGKIISLNMNNYKNLNDSKNDKPSSFKSNNKKIDSGLSKLSINIGRSDKLTPEMLLKLINKTIRSRNTEIGKITINKNFSTFEIDSKMKNSVISKMKHIRHYRKNILVTNYTADFEESISYQKKKKRKKRRFS